MRLLLVLLAALLSPPIQAAAGQPQVRPTPDNPGTLVAVAFYGTCPRGNAFVRFRATVSANDQELAQLVCNTYFYTVAAPGSYKFCINRKKCLTEELRPGNPYYFRVPPHMIGYGLELVQAGTGSHEIRSLMPLRAQQYRAADMISTDPSRPPAAYLAPRGTARNAGRASRQPEAPPAPAPVFQAPPANAQPAAAPPAAAPPPRPATRSVRIERLEAPAAPVAPGGRLEFVVEYLVSDPAAGSDPLTVEFGYRILEGEKVIYTKPPVRVQAPNGGMRRRIEQLNAGPNPGNYTIQTSLRYGGSLVEESATFVIK